MPKLAPPHISDLFFPLTRFPLQPYQEAYRLLVPYLSFNALSHQRSFLSLASSLSFCHTLSVPLCLILVLYTLQLRVVYNAQDIFIG